jgi:predicted enzyme related to lactoylglutathione lyase
MNMKPIFLSVGLVALAFACGYTLHGKLHPVTQSAGRVTGIGGIFFKSKDPKALRAWYKEHLGFSVNAYGAVFEWRQASDSTKKGFSQWSPFKESTTYFAPSTKDFMINYSVHNLNALVQQLKIKGVTILDTMESYDYGTFIHIMDLEGNKIELWEPNYSAYEALGKQMNSITIK